MVMIMVMTRKKVPATISAAEFKARCLQLMDAVAETGETIVVTKRGRAVAVLAPARRARTSAFGVMKGRAKILGDLVAPIDVAWEAAG
jgi:prevent-host-death family protein